MAVGRFITFEGGEGSGKSTQILALKKALSNQGIQVHATREPGGSPGAEAIRDLLVKGDVNRWDALTEAMLLNAARRNHIETTIRPFLKSGTWVLCDRFADSTLAYQGYGYGLPLEDLNSLHRMIATDLTPDLTLLLDISPQEGLARAASRHQSQLPALVDDRYERLDFDFHARVHAGFHAIAQAAPERFALINSAQSPEAVTAEMLKVVADRLVFKFDRQ